MKKLILFTVVSFLTLSVASTSALNEPAYKSVEVQPIPTVTMTIDNLLNDTNKERSSVGLPTLKLDPALDQSATDKCSDMIEKNYWAHNAPDGSLPWKFIQKYTYYEHAGENLGKGYSDADVLTAAWMASPTHKANILDPAFDHVGFAICGRYVVQHFTDVL